MPEHYPKHTTKAKIYCNTCRGLTMHRIDNGRKGPCLEHQTDGLSAKQRKAREQRETVEKNPALF